MKHQWKKQGLYQLVVSNPDEEMRLYTGYYLKDEKIYGPEGSTPFHVDETMVIHSVDGQTGYRLEEGTMPGVLHIYGLKGYTGYYVTQRHIQGPDKSLPWLAEQECV